MKKVLSYILIFIVVFVNLFAPFSVGMESKNGIKINKNKAEAWQWLDGTNDLGITLDIDAAATNNKIKFNTLLQRSEEIASGMAATDSVKIDRVDEKGNIIESKNTNLQKKGATSKEGETFFNDLEQDTTYNFNITVESTDRTWIQSVANVSLSLWRLVGVNYKPKETTGTLANSTPYKVTTLSYETQDFLKQDIGNNKLANEASVDSIMPACGIIPQQSGTFSGCIAQGLYYVLFIPTSYLFALSGVFFDNTFSYSVQDTSYRSSFVVNGWGLIRDFCNLFFIFILLYTAIATTLSLHGFKTKETIINVIIIGLFINFSLFATQIIIDASNITARVFYNADSIKITQDGANGVANATPGLKVEEGGVIPLSAALVNKVNPQNIIINAKKINSIQTKGSVQNTDNTKRDGIGVGSFVVIVLLASAVNIVGFIVFLSVGMIFVARVIGLWIAMIMAPLAFFTYILPEMSSIKMIGWKNWWPETLKLAFLAPIFIFFMYIILKFLETDLIPNSESGDGLTFFISILIPFAFIMFLLMKAKKIASDLSGEIGQQITKGINTVGGIAIGAATGGAAMLARNTIGRKAASVANNQELIDKAAAGDKGAQRKLQIANSLSKKSFDFRQTKAGSAFSKEMGMDLNKGTNIVGLDTKKSAGGYAAQQQRTLDKKNTFADSLGYDHKAYDDAGDVVSEKEKALGELKADKNRDHNGDEYKAEVAQKENEITAAKKDQERIKTARKNEYILTNKRKSGKIYDIDKFDGKKKEAEEYRESMTQSAVNQKKNAYEGEADLDKKATLKTEYEKANEAYTQKQDIQSKKADVGNKKADVENKKLKYENETNPLLKKDKQLKYEIAQQEYKDAQLALSETNKKYEMANPYRDANGNIKKFGHAEKDAAQATKQLMKEFINGMKKGAVVGGLAGSLVPVVGTVLGVVGGGLAGGIRELMHYDGGTNQKVGGDGPSQKFEDTYKAPTGQTSEHKTSGGDNHKADSDGHKEAH